MDNCGSFAMPRPLRMSALLLGGISLFSLATPALAQDSAVLDRLEAMEDRLDALQDENAALRAQIEAMRAETSVEASAPVAIAQGEEPAATTQDRIPGSTQVAAAQTASVGPVDVATETDDPRELQVEGSENFVGTNGAYAYRMLDHAENVNTKPLVQLAALQSGEL